MPEYLFNPLRQRIIDTMLYFEVFSYPMTVQEIKQASNSPDCTENEVSQELHAMVKEGFLFQIGTYFLTENNPNWVIQRREKNQRADRFLKIGLRMGKFIARFPFVRCVCISGSLSKHWMSENGDIDYFIITAPGKLWIARSFLILFKKIFLFNSHKYFCVNYFLDENNLEIDEKNRFTATETVTLIPVTGSDFYLRFCKANDWTREYYPNFPSRNTDAVAKTPNGIIKRMIEFCLNNPFGNSLNEWLRKKTLAYWKRKFSHMAKDEFGVAMKSTENVSKHHPNHFQEKVLKAHGKKLKEFESKFQIEILEAHLTA